MHLLFDISERANRSKLTLSLFVCMLASLAGVAQTPATQATVITTFSPPYTTPLSEFYTSNQLNVTITAVNGDIPSGKISVLIQGNNGIRIQNNHFTSAFTLDIAQGAPYQLQPGDIDEIFQQSNFTATGISVAQTFTEGLPPGSYEICFRVYTPSRTTLIPISPQPPVGCSSFVIQDSPTAVIVNTIVQPPPHTPQFDEYLYKIQSTLQSAASRRVRLFLTISGDNGIVIRSRQGIITSDVISLQGGVPYILSSIDLDPYFKFENLTFTGISANAVYNNGIPEGNYRFCIRAMDTNGNFISGDDPMGCSNLINIRLLEPPQLIGPSCGAIIQQTPAQNLIFTWTPPPGVPPGMVYTLRIVEMLDPSKNPNDAMLTATTPAFFETTIIGATTFLYGPAQPVLEPGRKYAWQIIAGLASGADFADMTGMFRNKGKSAVCWFMYEGTTQPPASVEGSLAKFQVTIPWCDSVIIVSDTSDFYIRWGWVLGDSLLNNMPGQEVASYEITIKPASKKTGKKIDGAFTFQAKIDNQPLQKYIQETPGQADKLGFKNDYWYAVQVKANTQGGKLFAQTPVCEFHYIRQAPIAIENSVLISGTLQYRFDNYPEAYPIPATSMRIRRTSPIKGLTPQEQALAEAQAVYTQTSSDGNFKIWVPKENLSGDSKSDSLYFQLDIMSPYYKPFTKIFSIAASVDSTKLGHLITTAYNYSMKLYVEKAFSDYDYKTVDTYYDYNTKKIIEEETITTYQTDTTIKEIKAGIPVMLYRKSKPGYIPPKEGQSNINAPGTGSIQYIPVGYGKTAIETGPDGKNRGFVKFSRLLCNVEVFAEDVYYIRAIDEKAEGSPTAPAPYQEGQYEAPEMQFTFAKPLQTDSTHFEIEATYEILSKDPPKSHLSGQLVYQWPSDKNKVLRPLANAKFDVVTEYLFNGKPVSPFKVLNSEGNFEATILTLEGEDQHMSLGDLGVVMATGITDANGRFKLDVVNLNAKGFLGMGEEEKKSYGGIEIPQEAAPKWKDILVDPANPLGIISIEKLPAFGQQDAIDFMNLQDMSMQQNALQNTLNSGNKFSPGLSFGLNYEMPTTIPGFTMEEFQVSSHGPQSYWYSSVPDGHLIPGKIERVYRIRIQDQSLYYDPETNIVVDAFKAMDIGPVNVMVKEIKWNVEVTDKNTKVPTEGLKAVVFREPSSKIKGMPEGEGDQQYRMKKLINPQLTGDVTLPEKPSSPAQNPQQGQLQQQGPGNVQLAFDPNMVFSGAQSWSEGEYEWLDDTVTNSKGHASFNRLLRGFKDYYLEVTSNPATGSLFYKANIKSLSLTATQFLLESNTTYAGYWDTRKVDVPEATIKVQVEPYPSRIAGRVVDKTSGLGMEKSLVLLFDEKENMKGVFLTKGDGYFEFLNVIKDEDKKLNLSFSLKAFHKGYKQETVINDVVSKTGKQSVHQILMVPAAIITGIVKNEQGQPVEAYIKRQDGLVVKNQKPPSGKLSLPGTMPGKFELPVPDGSDVTFYVIPLDVGYFPDTVTVKQVKKGITDLQTITVFRREHRMKFIVADASNTQVRIKGAQLFINKQQSTLTDSKGEASFNFENVSVNNYTVHVLGPEGQSYIPQVLNVKNEETEKTVNYLVKLKKGGTITGIVRLDGQPVPGARVYMDYQEQSQSPSGSNYVMIIPTSGGGEKQISQNVLPDDAVTLGNGKLPIIETYSNKQGAYTLTGIPINSGTVTVLATLDTSFTVVGDQHQVSLKFGSAQQDLSLKKFSQMNISSLYGFPLSIENISTTGNSGTIKVTGMVKLDATSNFDLTAATVTQLRVRDVPFEAKTIQNKQVGMPVPNEVKTEAVSSLKLQYADRYNVLVANNKAAIEELNLTRASDGKGYLSGYIRIVDNSFNFPSSYLNFADKDEFFLCDVSNGAIEINLSALKAFQADGETAVSGGFKKSTTFKKYNLCNSDKNPVKFQFISFNSTADPLNSYIDQEGKIHLDIAMDCKIPNAKPEQFAVNIKDIVLDNNKVYPAPGSAPLKLQLEKWNVEVKNWTVNPQKGGIYSNDALIKTGKLDIPFSEFNLRADMFVMNNFQLSKLQVGGGVKLLEDIAPGSALLVYDPKVGSDMSPHWKLSVTGKGANPAARIKNLSNYLNKNLEIEYIQLLSNNEDILTIKQSGPMIINKNVLAQYSPGTIFSGPDFFSVTGGLAIPAPRIDPLSLTLVFTGTPSSLKMEVKPVEMEFEGKGYVQFISDMSKPVTITSNQIVIPGRVEEPAKFNPIPATFFADTKGSSGDYHVDVEKQFKLNLTEKSNYVSSNGFNLLIDHGGMMVEGSDWNLLSFTGRLFRGSNPNNSAANVKDNVLDFTVHGDVQVDGKKMKVNNIPDLPGFKMTYEFENQRLIGNMALNGFDIGAGLSASVPVAEILFDPSGWYFGAGGEIKNAPVIGSFNAGIIIGEYTLNNTLKQIIMQYSVTNNLCDFNNQIKGFFVTGGKPLINESIGYNFAITSGYYKAQVGLESSFLMAFGNSPTFKLKMGAYGIVEASISSLICTNITGSASVKGVVEAGYEAGGFTGGADVSLKVATKLEQGIQTVVSGCEGFTTVFDESVCAGFNLKINKNGFSPKFSLSCSDGLTCK